MLVTLTNLTAAEKLFISSLYKELAPGEAIQVRRTPGDIEADQSLKTYVANGKIGLAFTEEAGDDVMGAGILEGGVSELMVLRHAFAAGGGGSADDVVVYNAAAPFAFRIVDVTIVVLTAVGASSCTVRSAAAGGGSALSDAIATATTGVKRNAANTATAQVAKGGSVILRRSDSGVAGELLLHVVRQS